MVGWTNRYRNSKKDIENYEKFWNYLSEEEKVIYRIKNNVSRGKEKFWLTVSFFVILLFVLLTLFLYSKGI